MFAQPAAGVLLAFLVPLAALGQVRATVEVEGRWGLIDTLGHWRIPPVWPGPLRYSEGLAEVTDTLPGPQPLRGYLDTAGRWAIPASFLLTEPFRDGLAIVARPDTTAIDTLLQTVGDSVVKTPVYAPLREVIDRTGQRVLGPPCTEFQHLGGGLLGAYDPTAKAWGVLTAAGDTVAPFRFSDARGLGSATHLALAEADERWLLWHVPSRRALTPARYRFIGPLAEGRCAVWDAEYNRWGALDAQGHETIPALYRYLGDFGHGAAWASENLVGDDWALFCTREHDPTSPYPLDLTGTWGLLDSLGRWVVPPTLTWVEGQSRASRVPRATGSVVGQDSLLGALLPSGSWAVAPVVAARRVVAGRWVLTEDRQNRLEARDAQGTRTLPPYPAYGLLPCGSELAYNLLTVNQGRVPDPDDPECPDPLLEPGTWYFYDLAAGQHTGPGFNWIEPFAHGFAPVFRGEVYSCGGEPTEVGVWGYANRAGQLGIGLSYSAVRPFQDVAATLPLSDED